MKYLFTQVFKKLRICNGLNVIEFSNERMLDNINNHFTYIHQENILHQIKYMSGARLGQEEKLIQCNKLNFNKL